MAKKQQKFKSWRTNNHMYCMYTQYIRTMIRDHALGPEYQTQKAIPSG